LVEVATEQQKQQYCDMWQQCFEDSEAFRKWLFDKRFLPSFSTYIKKDDEIVCCMQSYPMHIWVRGKIVKGVMLCGVCTDKRYRKQGLMTELFSNTMNMLSEKGYALAVHTPAVLHSYYRFGHIAVNRCKYIKSDNTAQFQKDNNIKEVHQNFKLLYECYEKFSQKYSGCASRTLADFLLKMEDYAIDNAKVIAYEYNSDVKGYAVFYDTDDIVQAVETVAENNVVYQKIVEGICTYAQGKKVSIKLPEDVCVKANSLYEEVVEKGVAGILDISKLMSFIGEKKNCAIQIEDNVIEKNNGVFDLDGTPTKKSPDIKLSAGNAVQLIMGYCSLEELQKRNEVIIYHNENAEKIANEYQKQYCYIIDEY